MVLMIDPHESKSVMKLSPVSLAHMSELDLTEDEQLELCGFLTDDKIIQEGPGEHHITIDVDDDSYDDAEPL